MPLAPHHLVTQRLHATLTGMTARSRACGILRRGASPGGHMTELDVGSSHAIHFRAWNGRKLRARATKNGHFLVSLGRELRWRRSDFLKYRNEHEEFCTAFIQDGAFLMKLAKGQPLVWRSESICYRGWADAPLFDRWTSRWDPGTELFEHRPLGGGSEQNTTLRSALGIGSARRGVSESLSPSAPCD